jgi:hypothetical protein
MDGAARLRLQLSLQRFLQAVRRLRTWQATDRLLGLLGGITDPELRLHRFGEHLNSQTPEEAAWTLGLLWDRVAAGDRRVQAICLGMLDFSRLARILDADRLTAVKATLEREEDPSAGLLAPEARHADHPEDAAAPRPKEPVGFRISLARRPARRLLDRLLFDPDARVVRTVLGNPQVTEADVVKLAASRRASPEVLQVIAQDDRWIVRYPVKVALANNPITPSRVVLGLLPYLLHQDLQALAVGSPRQAVREQATMLLSRRLQE